MNYNNFFDEIHGSPIKGCIHYFKIAIALAVAAIPEGLPAVITTCLALGTRKMTQNNAIVRRLPSVETLGCTSVICSDKTGTLTKNQMCAIKFAIVDESAKLREYSVKENKNSYSPLGCEVGAGSSFSADYKANSSLFISLATGCTINNRSRIDFEDGEFKRVGEPTEAALKVFAEKVMGMPTSEVNAFDFEKKMRGSIKEFATLDFTSERKAMSTIVTGYKNSKDLLLKGAPDRILAKCSKFASLGNQEREFTEAQKNAIMNQINELSAQGLRCLAIAESPLTGLLSDLNEDNKTQMLGNPKKFDVYESGATFLGIICIKDPVRPEVKPAIKDCKTAGIRVIMITGDSKETALSIARELNIIESHQDPKDCCFTGSEFNAMTDQQKLQAVGGESGKVFSRVEPKHKRDLVKCLIELGHVVAMTGDGVNDAPALKQAHIGIAMGITGTEVAKFASDMVLADDNFATIVKAVEEGRSIYSNMKAFIRYLISSNIGEVLSIFFTAMLGIPEGFSSVQLLWVNLVTDGPPATALGFNPPDFDIMKKPPRRQDDSLLSGWTLVRYTVIGFYVGFATVAIFVYWYLYAESGDGHTLVTWY
jgi:P-type Ca2+ transporter type 2C